MADKIYSFRIDIEDRGQVAQEINNIDAALQKLTETRKKAKKDLDKGNISQEKYEQILRKVKLKETELRVSKTQLAKADRNLATQMLGTKGSMENLRMETSLLIKEANKLNLATATGKKRFAEIQKQVDKNKTSIRNFDRSMSGSKTLVGEYGRGIVQSFKSMAAGLVGFTALIRVMKDLVQVTGNFDSATASLAAVTLSTREEIEELTEQAKELGAVTIFTATEVTELQISLAKLGFTAAEIADATPGVIKFATAVEADLGTAAKTAGIAVRAFGLDTLETEQAVAALAIGTTESALAFADYETILGTVGPVAKAYGFTLEDTIALTGRLRDAGFDASKAATATRNILLNLADANGALAQKLGGSVGTLDELVEGLITLDDAGIGLNETLEITDKRSVAAFAKFLAGAEDVKVLKDAVVDSRDELDEMVKLKLDSYAGDVKALGSAWEGFILKLKAGGGLRFIVQGLKDFTLELGNLDIALKKFNRQTDNELKRSFDLMEALDNRRGTHFSEMLLYFEEQEAITGGLLDPEKYAADFALIQGVNKKEGVALAKEYLRRKEETAKKETEIAKATAERIAQDEIDVAKRREADAQKAREDAAAEQAEKDAKALEKKTKEEIAAAEKAAKEKARAEKKIADEAQREREKYISDTAGATAKALEQSGGEVIKAEEKIAAERINILKQSLEAVKAEEAKGQEEKVDQLERTLQLESEIRLAEFNKDQVARDLLKEEAIADYQELATTLEGLKERLQKGDITKEFFDAQQEIIEAAQENITMTQAQIDEQTRLAAEQLETDLTEIKADGGRKRLGIEMENWEDTLAIISKSLAIASDITGQFSDIFKAQKEKELSAVGDNAKKREEIERKYAKREQALAIVTSIINIAQGVIKALGSAAPPLNFILAGITAAAGAVQLSTIKKQEFEEGGVVQSGSEMPGYPKSGDNTLALVKPGEAILNTRQQLAIGGPDVLRKAGVPGFAGGGVVGVPDPSVTNLNGGGDMVDLFRNIKVTQNVNELHRAEDELEVINETAEL